MVGETRVSLESTPARGPFFCTLSNFLLDVLPAGGRGVRDSTYTYYTYTYIVNNFLILILVSLSDLWFNILKMNDMKNTFRIETEDRYGRFSEYEVQASNKAEAEAIANKPANVVDGSIVLSVVQVTFNEPDSFRDMMPDSREVYGQ